VDGPGRGASNYGSEGWGFESLRARATFAQVSALEPLLCRCQIPVMGDPGSQVDSQESTPRTRAAGHGPGSTPTDGPPVVANGQPVAARGRTASADPPRQSHGSRPARPGAPAR
jgi:hypothetical protein